MNTQNLNLDHNADPDLSAPNPDAGSDSKPFLTSETSDSCPLSPRERDGVRGKTTSSLDALSSEASASDTTTGNRATVNPNPNPDPPAQNPNAGFSSRTVLPSTTPDSCPLSFGERDGVRGCGRKSRGYNSFWRVRAHQRFLHRKVFQSAIRPPPEH